MLAQRDLVAYERSYATCEFEPLQARMRKRKLLDVLTAWQPRRVLEIGCADDALFNHYGEYQRYVVVEPGRGFAAKARADALGDSRVRVVEAQFEDAAAGLAGHGFDCIVLSGLLHEVACCDVLFAAVASLCDGDTRVHVNVPNARSLHRLLALEMGLIADVHQVSPRQRALQQPRTFDLASLRALCAAHGFDVVEHGSYFVKPFTHAQMTQLRRDGLLSDAMLDGLYRLERHLPGLGSEIYVHLQCRRGGAA
jgi:SAM-dependent methyltransferase